VQGIGYITKLNHLGHVTTILSCVSHVKVFAVRIVFDGPLAVPLRLDIRCTSQSHSEPVA
jgi:hypothetical protein